MQQNDGMDFLALMVVCLVVGFYHLLQISPYTAGAMKLSRIGLPAFRVFILCQRQITLCSFEAYVARIFNFQVISACL